MFLSNVVTILDYETIFIQKNSEYALHIPEQNMKKLVFFYIRSQVSKSNYNVEANNNRLLEMFTRKTSHL